MGARGFSSTQYNVEGSLLPSLQKKGHMSHDIDVIEHFKKNTVIDDCVRSFFCHVWEQQFQSCTQR